MFIQVFAMGKNGDLKQCTKCSVLVHTLNLEVFIDKLQLKTIISHVCWTYYVKFLATTATNPANFISDGQRVFLVKCGHRSL